ncbi:MAG: hypothetical protein E7264_11045 [Lachnospiraceae bacterium]|nr:hypothetical protein [Lachnospiraceae bacterium]
MRDYTLMLIILGIIYLMLGIIAILGYVRYKNPKYNANTWQDGNRQVIRIIYNLLKKYVFPIVFELWRFILKLFCWLIGKYIKWWNKKNISKEVNNSLILTDKEYIEIKKRLKDNPFEFPRIGNIYLDDIMKGILRFDILAIGLVSKYKDIENTTIGEIVCSVVIDFYQETRGQPVNVYITVASPIRVQIAIALSEFGSYMLQKELAKANQCDRGILIDTLEEEIDIPEE